MIIYRALKLLNDEYPEHLGVYWTTDWNKAYPYGYKDEIKYYNIFTAKINDEDIDYEKTKLKSEDVFNHEKEIVLKSNVEITVIRMENVIIHPPEKHENKWMFSKTIKSTNTNLKMKT